MGTNKQVETINERYGKEFWSEQGKKGGKLGGKRQFKDPEVARAAQLKSAEARHRNKVLSLDCEHDNCPNKAQTEWSGHDDEGNSYTTYTCADHGPEPDDIIWYENPLDT